MRETPYSRLKNAVEQYITGVDYPHRKVMWFYPKEKLAQSWKLDDLAERVQAADQLGYDVKLRMADDGLRVEYVERPAPLDYSL